MNTRRFTPVIVALVTAFAFALCVTPLSSMDIWWHLRTGAEILRSGSLPQTDWYTYTDAGRPWIDLHWGFQLFVHGLYELGGVDLLILAKAAITTFAVLLVWRSAGRDVLITRSALVMALIAIVVSGQAIVRPKMLTLVALALFLAICRRAEDQPKAILWLIPVQVIWTNVQGLFALGPIIAICWLVDRLARRYSAGRFGLKAVSTGSLRLEFGATLGVLLACLVNPYGIDGALFPFELWKKFSVDQEIYSIVLAFQKPLDFIDENGWTYAFMIFQAALFALAAWSFLPRLVNGRWSVFRVLLFIAFSVLATKAIRNADLFAIVVGWLTLANLKSSTSTDQKPVGVKPLFGTLAVLVALCVSVPTGHLFRLAGDGRELALGETKDWYMHGPVKFASAPTMPAGAFVRHNGQAAVYIYATGPGRKVFMDGRLEVASKETLSRFHQVSNFMAASNPAFEELIRLPNGELPAILIDLQFSRRELEGLLLMDDRWRLVFADPTGTVFVEQSRAERLGLPDVLSLRR
ncbi:MAG: hypothetical protein ACI8TQ_003982 [Planctomycetota bacterium]|jgi:hypothetical protein